MAFNRFISQEDLDPQYNRHPYRVDWNITRDNRFTCSQAYMVYIWDQRISIQMKENFLFNSLCLLQVMTIELLNKMEGRLQFFYEQQPNENIFRDPMMLLEAIEDLSEYIKR